MPRRPKPLSEGGKSGIKNIEKPLVIINQLNGVTFTWGRNNEKDADVLVKDCEEHFPVCVRNINGEYKYPSFSALIALLIEGIKDLNGQVRTHQVKLWALEKKLKK